MIFTRSPNNISERGFVRQIKQYEVKQMNETEQLKNNETITPTEQAEVLTYGKDDLIKMPKFVEAVVVNVETKKAKEVFGDAAEKPEQEVIVITYESQEFSIKNNEVFNHYPIGRVPEKSKLGKFIAKYNTLSVGVKIDLLQKTSGYYGIVIE